jgi:hypothetical protein
LAYSIPFVSFEKRDKGDFYFILGIEIPSMVQGPPPEIPAIRVQAFTFILSKVI